MKDTQKRTNSTRGLSTALVVGAALILFAPVQASADWSWNSAFKVVKKVGKKVILPASVVFHGVAAAAEAVADGKSATEVAEQGLSGAVNKIGESIVETVEDVKTIGNAAVELYNR